MCASTIICDAVILSSQHFLLKISSTSLVQCAIHLGSNLLMNTVSKFACLILKRPDEKLAFGTSIRAKLLQYAAN
jgi:hypothetical protein